MNTNIHFLIISYLVILRIKTVSDEICGEDQSRHFTFNNFFHENRFVYEAMWKNEVEADRPRMTIWLMRIACWITKAVDTHPEYKTIIVFARQQWLPDRP
jgi:hypothetical protein